MITLLLVNIPGTVRSRYFKDQLSEILTTGTSFPSEMDVLQRQEQYASQEKLVALENFTSTISQVNSTKIVHVKLTTTTFYYSYFPLPISGSAFHNA